MRLLTAVDGATAEASVFVADGGVMEEFAVSAQRLEVFSRQLDEFAETVPAVNAYTQRYSDLTFYDKGALQALIASHDDARLVLQKSYDRVRHLLEDSSWAVAQAARYYETTDHTAAEAFDHFYAQAAIRTGVASYASGPRTDPLSTLQEPPPIPDDAMHGNFDIGMIMNYTSLTNDLNILIDQLTGVDLLGHVSQLLLGDWDSFARLASALHNAAKFDEAVAFDLADDLDPLRDGWKGAAAHAATEYFSSFDQALRRHSEQLERLSKAYLGVSFAINTATQQLNGILGSLVDKAVIIVIAAAAGTATAETGVGAVAGWGVALWQLAEFLKLWNRAARIIQTAIYIVFGAIPTVVEIAHTISLDTKAPALPAQPYHHPAIGPRS